MLCETCGRTQKQAIGGSAEWIFQAWNRQLHKTSWNKHGEHWSEKTLIYHDRPVLDIGPEWKSAVLEYCFHPAYGERQSVEIDFALFVVPDRTDASLLVSKDGYECVIDKSRCFSRIILRTITGTQIDVLVPEFKRTPGVQMWIGRSWCTDETWGYRLYVTAHNAKWHQKMIEMLGAVGQFDRLALQG